MKHLILSQFGGHEKISEPYVIKADSNESLGGKDPGGFTGFF